MDTKKKIVFIVIDNNLQQKRNRGYIIVQEYLWVFNFIVLFEASH